jgi:hypothetical protein
LRTSTSPDRSSCDQNNIAVFSRQFLLRPDGPTNNAFLYCLIDAASRCEIDVLLPCAMSNHYHVVIYDRAGRYSEFIEHFS